MAAVVQIEPAAVGDARRPDLALARDYRQATILQRSGPVLLAIVGPVAAGTPVGKPAKHLKLALIEWPWHDRAIQVRRQAA